MEKVKSIICQRDIRVFYHYLDTFDGDYNRFIVIDNDVTQLNLLHVLAGFNAHTSGFFLESCVRALLERSGVDINFTGKVDHNFGITAAHIAVQWQNVSILKILLEYDCDLLICDSNGQNVQDYAEKGQNLLICQLIDQGIYKWFRLHGDLYSMVLEYPRRGKEGSPFRHTAVTSRTRFESESSNFASNRSQSISSLRTQSFSQSSCSSGGSYLAKTPPPQTYNMHQRDAINQYKSCAASPQSPLSVNLMGSVDSWSSLDSERTCQSSNEDASKNLWPQVDRIQSKEAKSDFDWTNVDSVVAHCSTSSPDDEVVVAAENEQDNIWTQNNILTNDSRDDDGTLSYDHNNHHNYNDDHYYDDQYRDHHHDHHHHHDRDTQILEHKVIDQNWNHDHFIISHKDSGVVNCTTTSSSSGINDDYERNYDSHNRIEDHIERQDKNFVANNCELPNYDSNNDYETAQEPCSSEQSYYLDAAEFSTRLLDRELLSSSSPPAVVVPPGSGDYPARLSVNSDVSYTPTANDSFDSQATEIYSYKDSAMNIELIEERYLGVSRLQQEQQNTEREMRGGCGEANELDGHDSSNQSIASVASTIDELILKMTNAQLFDHLTEVGAKPGPITGGTLRVYQRKANKLRKTAAGAEQQQQHNYHHHDNDNGEAIALMTAIVGKLNLHADQSFSNDPEADRLFRQLTNYPLEFDMLMKKKFPFEDAVRYETQLIAEFDQSAYDDASTANRNTYFCYLLLDPAISDNLPARANMCLEKMLCAAGGAGSVGAGLLELLDPKLFASFILSIFYVGKGHHARSYQHFYDAVKATAAAAAETNEADQYHTPKSSPWQPKSCRKLTPKIERILGIWSSGKGAVSLHCFSGITSDEAFTREALMIEVLSLSNLTNQISGQFRCRLQLNRRQRNILGTYLLFKAFVMLLLNGERQVKKPSSK